MTVKELKALIKDIDDDAEVFIEKRNKTNEHFELLDTIKGEKVKRDIHIGNEVQNNTLYVRYKAVDALIIIAKKTDWTVSIIVGGNMEMNLQVYESNCLQIKSFLQRNDLAISITDTLKLYIIDTSGKLNVGQIISIEDYPDYYNIKYVSKETGSTIFTNYTFARKEVYKKYYKNIEMLFEKVIKKHIKNIIVKGD